jgi:hypothetical protein
VQLQYHRALECYIEFQSRTTQSPAVLAYMWHQLCSSADPPRPILLREREIVCIHQVLEIAERFVTVFVAPLSRKKPPNWISGGDIICETRSYWNYPADTPLSSCGARWTSDSRKGNIGWGQRDWI